MSIIVLNLEINVCMSLSQVLRAGPQNHPTTYIPIIMSTLQKGIIFHFNTECEMLFSCHIKIIINLLFPMYMDLRSLIHPLHDFSNLKITCKSAYHN